MISVRELTVVQDGFQLGPLDFELGVGTLAIVGPAQSGKTTLLKALCGLVPASAGSVLVDGEDLTAASEDERAALRSRFGMVFQSDALFDSLDALANVALPLLRRGVERREASRQAHEAIEQVGLAGQEHVLPERLSGGMRKRLGLARAIVARPRYLLADDPLAGLDPGTSARVLGLLLELWKGHGGLVVATADPAPLWEKADDVLVLDAGTVVAHGPPASTRRAPRVAELLGEVAR